MKQRMPLMAAGLLLAYAATAFGQPASPQPTPQSFNFALIGDLGYTASQEPLVDNVFADLQRTPLAFVVHVGDLGSPRAGSCTEAHWAKRREQFRALAHPLIYTPGDNEWVDCHNEQGVPGGDPLERLVKLRAFFFEGGRSLGQRTIALLRQSDGGDPQFAKYRENARWDFGGVTFLTLHAPGSNNGKGRTPAGDAEFAERNGADIAWLRQGFAHAKANGSRAIMVVQQANIFPQYPPFPGSPGAPTDGFNELRAALAKEAVEFGKPVALSHGDSHYFRVDKPFMRRRSPDDPIIENLTRIEGFGAPFHHWVQVTVDPADPEVFVVRPRIVAANILPRR